jgi:hypothetical protein
MTTKQSAQKSATGWASAGEPLPLSDAGYLAQELSVHGIRCQVRSLEQEAAPDKPVYAVMVQAERQADALQIRGLLQKEEGTCMRAIDSVACLPRVAAMGLDVDRKALLDLVRRKGQEYERSLWVDGAGCHDPRCRHGSAGSV